MGLTVSGGVSLGSFEAGYLSYLFEVSKLNPRLSDQRIFTGASAGSVNALLSAMASCTPPQKSPEQSLFFRTWVPVGLEDLFDPRQTTPTGLFTKKPLLESVERVKAEWMKGLPETCDVTLGVATTRFTATSVEFVKDRVTLPRTEAKFVFRIRGQGAGKPPLLSNHVTRDNPLKRPLLPTAPDGNIAFDSLATVLLASASFPVAFPPMPILHCETKGIPDVGAEAETPPECMADQAQTLLFIDGGVFDNQPLRLAVQLAQRGLVQEGGLSRWRPVPDDATIPYLSHILGQLVSSGRTKELQALLEDQSSIRKHIGSTRTYFMPLSHPLRNFFGEHCRAAFQQQPPPALPGLGPDRDWRFKGEESVMDHQLRRLAANGFVFDDLKVPPNRSYTAKRAVAVKVREMVSALSKNQADVGGTIIPLARRLGAQVGLVVAPPMRGLDWSFALAPQLGVEFDKS